MHALIHADATRVLCGSLMALLLSYTTLLDSLRVIVLALTAVHIAIKICQALKGKPKDDQ